MSKSELEKVVTIITYEEFSDLVTRIGASEISTMDQTDEDGIEKLLRDYNEKLVDLTKIGTTIKKPFLKRRGFVWINGYWGWSGHTYIWINGFWEKERHGFHWHDGYWEETPHGFYWIEGYWCDIY